MDTVFPPDIPNAPLPPMPRIARWTKAEITLERHQIFDPRLLPEEIRANPAYNRAQITRRLVPDAPSDRPERPKRRFLAALSEPLAAQNRK